MTETWKLHALEAQDRLVKEVKPGNEEMFAALIGGGQAIALLIRHVELLLSAGEPNAPPPGWQGGWEHAREAAAQVCDEFAKVNTYYSARARWAAITARDIRALPVWYPTK